MFIVDTEAVKERDLTCDDSGMYDSHSSPTSLVEIIMDSEKKFIKDVQLISRSKVPLDDPRLAEDNIFLVRRQYSTQNKKSGKCVRIISKVYHLSKLCKYAIIQYIGERQSLLRPHGNSKLKSNLYMRTKPSVISKEQELACGASPKQVINIIDQKIGKASSSPSDSPRDRQQIYNAKKKGKIVFKARNTGKVPIPDFSKLIAALDSGDFVKNVDFASREKMKRIHPNSFAATDNMLKWIKTFCNPNAVHKAQLGIDMTYKIGPFFTTCLSFPHPMYVHKGDPQKHPTIFAGMSTSTCRQKDDYLYLATQLKANGVEKLIYGTDGELALELGLEAMFPIEDVSLPQRSIKLRCFNHVKEDLQKELKKHPNLENTAVIKSILGNEINGKRELGLVDSKNFEEDYTKLSSQWPPEFKHYIESKQLKVRSLKETFKKNMGREVRIAAGLGNPPNKFDNQRAESMNSVLKESVGSRFLDQSSVHDLVFENLVIPQERELVKAIYGHGEYRLAPSFKHLEVHPLKWNTMTEEQKQNQIKRVFLCKVHCLKEKPIQRKLSLEPEECFSLLPSLPTVLVKQLWKAAEITCSYHKINELQNGHFCIAEDDQAYIFKETSKGFSCQCFQFKKLGLCGHILVLADDRGRLKDVLKNFKYHPSIAIHKNKPPSAGEKRVKKPRKGKQNVKKLPIEFETDGKTDLGVDLNVQRPFQYCEPWHNDEPFKIVYVTTISKEKQTRYCATCNSVISIRNAVPPFDVIFNHQERYEYPVQTEEGNTIWKTTKKKMASKFYCLKRDCLLRRHPYFWCGLIDTSEVSLQEMHFDLLREELGYDI